MVNSWGKAPVWAIVGIALFFFVACGDTKADPKDADSAGADTYAGGDSNDDPGSDAVTDTGGDTDTGATDDDVLLTEPPAPIIGLRYNNPISGVKDHRVIKDPVNMDVSLSCPRKEGADEATCGKIISDTVVGEDTITAADFNNACCAQNWQDRYCIKYRWELIETPTPLAPETRITLDNIPDGGEGNWYQNCGDQDPTLASFKGYMTTPTPDNKNYKVQIQAITIDKQTQSESDIAQKTDMPNIIPSARVMVQLTWKEGLLTRADLDKQEGVAVDLDIHLIKKKGMDYCAVESGAAGLLCTQMATPLFPSAPTPTHDDCYFNDVGNNGSYPWANCDSDFVTISWYAALDIDNRWGGGNYTNPEIIDLGPIDDQGPKDGQPDVAPFSDDYLIVVNYNRCQNLQEGGSEADCVEGGADYNVHATVDIFVDGVKAPRTGKDDATLSRSDFVIRPNEWVVVGLISWDQTLTGKWSGDAVVKNAPSTHEKVCAFDLSYCINTPIWDWTAFETWVTSDPYVNGGGGICYDYGTRQ